MSHHHLRFKGSCSFKSYGNNDDNSSTADGYVADAGNCADDGREKSNNAEEHCTDEGDFSDDSGNEVCGRFTGMWLDWPPYCLRPTTRFAY